MPNTIDGPMCSAYGSYPETEMASTGTGPISTESGAMSLPEPPLQPVGGECGNKVAWAIVGGVTCALEVAEGIATDGISLIGAAECGHFGYEVGEAVNACSSPKPNAVDTADVATTDFSWLLAP